MIQVEIRWPINPFRGDRFAEGWRPAAELVLDYGATEWSFTRNLDGRLDFVNAYGWWEGPPKGSTATWSYHPQAFGRWNRSSPGGAETSRLTPFSRAFASNRTAVFLSSASAFTFSRFKGSLPRSARRRWQKSA